MQHRILWPVVGGVVLILALFGLIWAFGGYDGTSSTGGMGAALGIIAPIALGIGLMALIFYGRRSRRDEKVHRTTQDNDFD
jgi:hypothetical protein